MWADLQGGDSEAQRVLTYASFPELDLWFMSESFPSFS